MQTVEKVKVYDHGVEKLSGEDLRRSYRAGDIHSPRIDITEALQLEMRHFVDQSFIVTQFFEIDGVLATDDSAFGIDAGFQGIHRGSGFALLGAWAGGFLRVGPVDSGAGGWVHGFYRFEGSRGMGWISGGWGVSC